MSKILLRAGKSPVTPLTHEQSLAVGSNGVYGSNSGNALFYSSVHRALSTPGAEIVPDTYKYERRGGGTERSIHEVNDRYDHYVLPMANSYRDDFMLPMKRLTAVIEKLAIPTTVIGIGAQMPRNASFSELTQEQKSAFQHFTRAVLKRSPSIGVRGEYTADLLKYLGFSDSEIAITGCPSLFTYGASRPDGAKKEPTLQPSSRVALNFTPSVPGMSGFLNRAMRDQPNSVVIPQDHRRLAMMLWGENPPSGEDEGLPVHTGHTLYLEDRLRFFVDARSWVDYLRNFDFVVGTRIHGCVAGVLAGVPTLLLAHDSRTVELADYHAIPYRLFKDVTDGTSVAELYDGLEPRDVTAVQRKTFEQYVSFLDAHELPHIFDPERGNPQYDIDLARAELAGPAGTLMAEGVEGRQQVMARIAWLRQGQQGDHARPRYAYNPPVAARSTRLDAARQADRLDQLSKSLKSAQNEVDQLRQTADQLRRAAGEYDTTVDGLRREIAELRVATKRLNGTLRRQSADLREVRAARRLAKRLRNVGRNGPEKSAASSRRNAANSKEQG